MTVDTAVYHKDPYKNGKRKKQEHYMGQNQIHSTPGECCNLCSQKLCVHMNYCKLMCLWRWLRDQQQVRNFKNKACEKKADKVLYYNKLSQMSQNTRKLHLCFFPHQDSSV